MMLSANITNNNSDDTTVAGNTIVNDFTQTITQTASYVMPRDLFSNTPNDLWFQ